MADRAVAPVVGKLLAAGLAVLYIAGMTAVLLGGVVPDYRTAAGEEMSERVLAEAAATVERAVPDTESAVDGRARTTLPESIRDAGYTLVLDNGTLRLDHPDDGLDASTRLSLPPRVGTHTSTWDGGGELVVRVSGSGGNATVRLEDAS